MAVLLIQCDCCGRVFDPYIEYYFIGLNEELLCSDCTSEEEKIKKPNLRYVEELFNAKYKVALDYIKELKDNGVYKNDVSQ